MKPLVISLCDITGAMVWPWAEAGYDTLCVDIQREPGLHVSHHVSNAPCRQVVSTHWTLGCDVRTRWWHQLPRGWDSRVAMVFAFPPCTNLAVSGARWFQKKGLGALVEGLDLVDSCREVCEYVECPWMLENPRSTLSTYWRKPDHTFHPHEYAGYHPQDHYTKLTCLWTGNGFRMPDPLPLKTDELPDAKHIHHQPPGPERANIRSATPMGFARAVFEENAT